jgi:hypothetical protein
VHRYATPTRPLPPACRWLLQDGSAHLLWNAGCIAYVYRDRVGFQSVIQWGGPTLRAPCASIDQGMRWIERWMEKRQGLPGTGGRREIRKRGWAAALGAEARLT